MNEIVVRDNLSTKIASLKTSAVFLMTAMYCTMMSSNVVLANQATGDVTNAITSGLSSGAEQIWGMLRTVVMPLAAVALAVCAVKILWGGQKAAEEAKSLAIKIVIAVALVMLAPALVGVIRGWFAGASKWSDAFGGGT